MIVYHLLNTVLGAFIISYSFSPNYTLERYVLFLLYALKMLEVTQLTGIKTVPGFFLMAQRSSEIRYG